MRRKAAAIFRVAFSRNSAWANLGPVDGDEQIEPAFLGTNLGNINVEIADGIRLGSVPRQAAGSCVTLQTAVQTGAGQIVACRA